MGDLSKREEKRRSELGLYLALEKTSVIIYVSKEREKELGMAKYVCVEVDNIFETDITWFEELNMAKDYVVGEIMRQMGIVDSRLFTRVKDSGNIAVENEDSCCYAEIACDRLSGWFKDDDWEIRYFVEEVPQ